MARAKSKPRIVAPADAQPPAKPASKERHGKTDWSDAFAQVATQWATFEAPQELPARIARRRWIARQGQPAEVDGDPPAHGCAHHVDRPRYVGQLTVIRLAAPPVEGAANSALKGGLDWERSCSSC